MGYNKQDLEDATQDFYLEHLESQAPIPEINKVRIKAIADVNHYRGRRIGSWVNGTLQYVKVYSLNMIIETYDRQFADENSIHNQIDDLMERQQLIDLIFRNISCPRESSFLSSYLKNEGSPGLMATEFKVSPQYINRMMNRLINNLKKRIIDYEKI